MLKIKDLESLKEKHIIDYHEAGGYILGNSLEIDMETKIIGFDVEDNDDTNEALDTLYDLIKVGLVEKG
jgi:uncharacterized protein YuzE